MNDNTEVKKESTVSAGRPVDDALTPTARRALGDLALVSQDQFELSEAVAESRQTLTLMVDRHPEFAGCSSELREKMAELQHHLRELGTQVMRYSHTYEDAVVVVQSREQTQS